MTILRSHMVLMFLYAAATALFFALLWKEDPPRAVRTFLTIFCASSSAASHSAG